MPSLGPSLPHTIMSNTTAQALKWVNQTVKDKQMIAAAKLKAQQKKEAQANGSGGGGGGGGAAGGRATSKHPEPIEPIFTVAPQVKTSPTRAEPLPDDHVSTKHN